MRTNYSKYWFTHCQCLLIRVIYAFCFIFSPKHEISNWDWTKKISSFRLMLVSHHSEIIYSSCDGFGMPTKCVLYSSWINFYRQKSNLFCTAEIKFCWMHTKKILVCWKNGECILWTIENKYHSVPTFSGEVFESENLLRRISVQFSEVWFLWLCFDGYTNEWEFCGIYPFLTVSIAFAGALGKFLGKTEQYLTLYAILFWKWRHMFKQTVRW